MLMSVNTENGSAQGQTTVLEKESVYASLFDKINLTPATSLGDINAFLDDAALSDAPAGERLTAAMQVFMDCIRKSGQPVEKLDKTLIDHHIAELDFQISRQLDAVMHHAEFQKVESLWRGLKQLVDNTDYRQNVKTEILDVSKEDLRQDFEDAPELIQSGLYWHTYTAEYDTPGGEPIGSVISAYEFDASPQDVALLRNISKVSAAAHMPFIGAVGPKFFLKESMEEVAAIKDIGNYFDRAEYIKWKSFRDTDDARYIGLVMPRVLGRLPYGPDTVPVRSFNYVEQVKGPDHEKYLWTSASFSFASNMVKSFINNGWCVQIRGPQAGGAVKDLPIHLYDLGTGNQVKIPSEVMIPETREFEFANLGFIPLSYYKNRDYACFFSANSAQKPALYDTADATANSRINARLPYIFLLSRIAHYLKLIQRENIGTTKDRRLLPRRALQSTVLDTVMKTTSANIAVRNLCAPTLPCYPPAQDRFHWRVLSHLGSGFLSMMDNADVLRGTLALYEWTDSEMNRRRLEAILDVKHSETVRFEQGYLVRGVQIEVTLDSHGFAGRGDICLFGEMLSRFFALYTDIYLFNRLIIILQPTGERLEWEEKHNRRIPG
ncbi:type VI secretion system contractile sheath large subunit [Enterobacter sp. A8]